MGSGGGSVTDKAIALPIDDTRMANANCWRWVMVMGGVGWGPSYHLCIYALYVWNFLEKKKRPNLSKLENAYQSWQQRWIISLVLRFYSDKVEQRITQFMCYWLVLLSGSTVQALYLPARLRISFIKCFLFGCITTLSVFSEM